MSAPNPLDSRSTANLLDYHGRQLSRALLGQADMLEGGAPNEADLRVATARIANHLAVIDYLAPPEAITVMGEATAWPPTQAVTEILAWLDAAPEDWPFTGADIAEMIRQGCKGWDMWMAGKRRDVTLADLLGWLDSQWGQGTGRDFAALARDRFELSDQLPGERA